MPYDWVYYDLVKNVSREKTFHACQIPQKLSEMLILGCTQPEDTVFVLFGGSGSEIEVCQQLGRQFISAEIDPKYHTMITDRPYFCANRRHFYFLVQTQAVSTRF